MLQSVPDPFDAYGPPQSEDQIFSILAPLSIMNQPASSSSTPSPMAGTPERDPVEQFSSSLGSNKVTSWLPTTSTANSSITFPTEATAWAGTPPSSSPPSTFPKLESPPQSQHLSRRHSIPSGSSHRREESKLRSVLSVIDESRSPRHESFTSSTENDGGYKSDDTAPAPAPHNLNGTTTPPCPPAPDTASTEPGSGQPAHPWSFTYGQSPYEYENSSNSSTPRNSMAFTSSPPPAPSESLFSDGTRVSDLRDSGDLLRTPHTSI